MQNLRTYCLDVAQKIGINSAILLNQIIYWQSKSKNADKSFYKLDSEWVKELGFASVWVVRRAKKKLIEHGYIDTNYRLHNNKRTTVIYLIKQAIVKDFPDMFTGVQSTVKSNSEPTKIIKGAINHKNTRQIKPTATVSDVLVQSDTKVHGNPNIAVKSLQTHIDGVPISVIETPLINQIKDDLFKRVKPKLVESDAVIHDRILAMRKTLEAKLNKT